MTEIAAAAFAMSSLEEIAIPESVTSISDQAFDSCANLTTITITNFVTAIENNAFLDCYKLIEVINHSSLPITPGTDTFGCVALYALEAHAGETKIENQNGYLFYSVGNTNYLISYVGNETILALPKSFRGANCEISPLLRSTPALILQPYPSPTQ